MDNLTSELLHEVKTSVKLSFTMPILTLLYPNLYFRIDINQKNDV